MMLAASRSADRTRMMRAWRSEWSTGATLAGEEGGSDRSDGAGRPVGPLPMTGDPEGPARTSKAALLYSRLVLSAPPHAPVGHDPPSGAYPMGRSLVPRASLRTDAGHPARCRR